MRDDAARVGASTAPQRDEAAWSGFLARWTLLAALAYVGLFGAFGALLAAARDAGAADFALVEFVGASRSPAVHRLMAALDALVWLGIGGTLLGFAALFAPWARRRAALLAACGVGQLAGVIGAYMQLGAVNELAVRYAAAAPDQQAALVQAHLTLAQIVSAHFGLGQLLYGAGFLLLASAGLSLGGFPRWLAAWFGLSGIWSVTAQVFNVGGSAFFMSLFLVDAVAGLIAPFLAVAVVFWRRAPVLGASAASP